MVSGVGIALLPCGMGDNHPELVRLNGLAPVEVQDIWLLTHSDLRRTARIQALSRCLVAAFDNNADLLLGRRPALALTSQAT